MFINDAFAQGTTIAQQQGGVIEFLTPLVVVIAIFYMLVWRPQGKRMKAHAEMVKALEKGDKIITTGGIHATVVKTTDETVVIAIAEGVNVTLSLQSVTALFEKSKGDTKKSTTNTKNKTAKKSTKKTKKAA